MSTCPVCGEPNSCDEQQDRIYELEAKIRGLQRLAAELTIGWDEERPERAVFYTAYEQACKEAARRILAIVPVREGSDA